MNLRRKLTPLFVDSGKHSSLNTNSTGNGCLSSEKQIVFENSLIQQEIILVNSKALSESSLLKNYTSSKKIAINAIKEIFIQSTPSFETQTAVERGAGNIFSIQQTAVEKLCFTPVSLDSYSAV